MILKKIILENIRSYESYEINFPKNSTLLSGDIGSGKTSILLAIEFALFGLQPGQRGSSLLRNGKNSGKVILEFEIDNQSIIIERTLKRGSKTISQDYTSLTLNGHKEELSITELKTRILSLMNYPQEFVKKTNLLYRYTVYSPQEEMKQIIIEDAESRLNIIRNIFGVDKYKRIKENLQLTTIKFREDIRFLQAKTHDLEELKIELTTDKERVKKIGFTINYKDKEFQNKINQRKKIEKDISKLEEKIKEKEKFEQEVEKTNLMNSNKRIQLKELEEIYSKLQKKILSKEKSFNEEELNSTIKNIKQKKELLRRLNDNYIEAKSVINSINLKIQDDLEKKNRIFKIDLCPTCLQNVSEVHKHNILNDTETSLTNSKKEIKKLKNKIKELISLIERQGSILSELECKKSNLELLKIKQEEANNTEQEIEKLEKTIKSLKGDIELLTGNINLLKSSIFEFSKFESIYKSKELELKQLLNQERIIEIEIAGLKKEEEILGKQILLLEEKVKEKEKTVDKLNNLIEIENWLSKDFANLISFTEKNIMFKLRQDFSKLFNKWFEMLTTDNFYVHLDENFTPIITQGEYELDYSFLSGGERTAVALAYRLALNQTINSVFSRIKTKGLVILDEPTDGFSDQQLDKVREVLQELSIGQLILVSHEQKVENFVDHIIKLKKEHGISKTD